MNGIMRLNIIEIIIRLPNFPQVVIDIGMTPIIIIVPALIPVVAEIAPTEAGPIVIISSAYLRTEIPWKRHFCSCHITEQTNHVRKLKDRDSNLP
jgi:hypothetical protein